jgi:predicted dehydrogenase
MKPGIVRVGLVGAGREGASLHAMAAALDGEGEVVASAGGRPAPRPYANWRELVSGEKELPADQRVQVAAAAPGVEPEFVRAAVEAGMHVLADPSALPTGDAGEELARSVKAAGTVFASAMPHTGYPMVRRAMELVREKRLGTVRRVVVEMGGPGSAGALRDLGAYAEGLAASVAGLKLRAVCADWTMNQARRAEDDASVLLRFDGTARGVALLTQGRDETARLRVQGTEGALAWASEQPDRLWVWGRDGTVQVMSRGGIGAGVLGAEATRFGPGLVEGAVEALANLYRGVYEAVRAKSEGRARKGLGREFPTLAEGLRAVAFAEAAATSARSGGVWVDV